MNKLTLNESAINTYDTQFCRRSSRGYQDTWCTWHRNLDSPIHSDTSHKDFLYSVPIRDHKLKIEILRHKETVQRYDAAFENDVDLF